MTRVATFSQNLIDNSPASLQGWCDPYESGSYIGRGSAIIDSTMRIFRDTIGAMLDGAAGLLGASVSWIGWNRPLLVEPRTVHAHLHEAEMLSAKIFTHLLSAMTGTNKFNRSMNYKIKEEFPTYTPYADSLRTSFSLHTIKHDRKSFLDLKARMAALVSGAFEIIGAVIDGAIATIIAAAAIVTLGTVYGINEAAYLTLDAGAAIISRIHQIWINILHPSWGFASRYGPDSCNSRT